MPEEFEVFISYSSKDRAFAERLANDLSSHGLRVWWDTWEMKVGDSLNAKIQEGISSSAWLSVILSPNSVTSPWVERELNVALIKEWLLPRRQPSGQGRGAEAAKGVHHFDDQGDGTLVMNRENNLVVRLYNKEGIGDGTPFSYFGFLGHRSFDPVNAVDSLENCVAVLVLAESPSNWSEFLGAGCRVGCMAKVYNMAGIGSELAIRLHFEGFERPDNTLVFVISTSGGSFSAERRWVSLLMSSMKLMVLPDLDGYERAFVINISDDNSTLRKEMMKALI